MPPPASSQRSTRPRNRRRGRRDRRRLSRRATRMSSNRSAIPRPRSPAAQRSETEPSQATATDPRAAAGGNPAAGRSLRSGRRSDPVARTGSRPEPRSRSLRGAPSRCLRSPRLSRVGRRRDRYPAQVRKSRAWQRRSGGARRAERLVPDRNADSGLRSALPPPPRRVAVLDQAGEDERVCTRTVLDETRS